MRTNKYNIDLLCGGSEINNNCILNNTVRYFNNLDSIKFTRRLIRYSLFGIKIINYEN
jgi:hypothetical protein